VSALDAELAAVERYRAALLAAKAAKAELVGGTADRPAAAAHHPFTDGNGRTARAASYIVLCAHLGLRLPGSNTIPDQIAADKTPYYLALEAADAAAEQGHINVSQLENH
jgi:fido (protein-threonine AMPylation protein)